MIRFAWTFVIHITNSSGVAISSAMWHRETSAGPILSRPSEGRAWPFANYLSVRAAAEVGWPRAIVWARFAPGTAPQKFA
jgi:hypothetical protein